MQTAFTYNGILVKDVLTESIVFDAEKESTGVDQIGVACSGSWTGVVHISSGDHTGHRVSSLQNSLDDVLMALSKDRRKFELTMGRVALITVVPGAVEPGIAFGAVAGTFHQRDLNNGPIPRVEVLKIVAGVSATIRFSLRWTIPNCGTPGGAVTGDGLVNFRMWISENVDCKTWLTSRTFQGRIRVAHKNISPHALARVVTVPPLEAGFRRDFMRWDESSDGLHLDFSFQDREIVASAPYNKFAGYGAVDWSGRLVHSTETLGATSNISVNVRLTGNKKTSVLALAELAYLVIAQKIQYQTVVKGQQAFFEYFEIAEELADNVIECQARIKHTGRTRDMIGLFNLENSPFIGQPMGDLGVGYDSNIAFSPAPTAGVGTMFLSVLQTACQPARMPIGRPTTPPKNVPKTQNQPFTSPGTQNFPQSQSQSAASPSQLDAMYFSWKMTSDLFHVSGRIPVANGAVFTSTDSPITIVNLHRPATLREYRIEAERLNKAPQLPSFLDNFRDLNGILHTVTGTPRISPSVPQLSADGRNLLHHATMEVCYALDKAIAANMRIAVGAPPYRTSSLNDPTRSIGAESFLDPRLLLS